MTEFSASPRVHGLDTLRALAIVLVFMYHYMCFVSGSATFGVLSDIGWVGVDLFFALSGYLIGNQIFAALRSSEPFSLPRFYARRFLRTLPNYYVVLALYFLWPSFRGSAALPPAWKFLTFTQNYHLTPGTAFSHAWSLCVEEQFYLLLPAAALIIASLRKSLRWAWLSMAAVVLAGMVLRANWWQASDASDNTHFYQYIYYSSFCRFDELVAGVALALVKNFHGPLWRRLTAQGNRTLCLGAASTALSFYLFLTAQYSFGVTVFAYPMLAFSFALLILAALSDKSLLRSTRVPGAASLALCSYAIYLTHKQLCIRGYGLLKDYGYDSGAPSTVVLLTVLSLGVGYLMFALVESPFMRLRQRWVPSNFAPAGQGGAALASTTALR